jgi:hypothetical protein
MTREPRKHESMTSFITHLRREANRKKEKPERRGYEQKGKTESKYGINKGSGGSSQQLPLYNFKN